MKQILLGLCKQFVNFSLYTIHESLKTFRNESKFYQVTKLFYQCKKYSIQYCYIHYWIFAN